jgi:O-antigen ligase
MVSNWVLGAYLVSAIFDGVLYDLLNRFVTVVHYRLEWFPVIVLAVAMYFVLRLSYFGEIGERFLNLLTNEQDMSDIERTQMVELGIELFKERPIHGYGIGNYAALCFRDTYSHHNYVELLVSGGVVALVLYYLMLLVPGLSFLQSKKRGQKMDPMHLMLLVWLAVELVFGVAMVQLYNKNSWLLIGVLMAEAAHTVSRKPIAQEKYDEIAE